VDVGALCGRQRQASAGPVHDGGEALLRIFDEQEIVEELLLDWSHAGRETGRRPTEFVR
jgi:hypothetical protein